MNTNSKYDAIIIGAGLTGLTIAFYLVKAGLNIKLIESTDRVGGVIQSHKEDGFIYETGPNSGVLSTPEAAELFEDLSGLCQLETASDTSKDRWIWKDNKWESLPSGLIPAIKTPLFKFKDKLKVLAEPFIAKGINPDESVAEIVRRRLGESFLDYAVDPFISGIYAGNPEKLITKFALPKLYKLEQSYGSFIKGAIKKQSEGKTDREKKATKKVFSTKNGLENLVRALESKIGKENIILNANNISIENEFYPFIINFERSDIDITLEADYVVTTSGGYSLESMLKNVDKSLISSIKSLRYAKVSQVILGFKEWKGIKLKSFGGLVPEKEKRNILGVLFMSSIFSNRAPQNGALLSIFIGGERKPEIIEYPDEEILALAESEVDDMLKLKGDRADLKKIVKYENAIPQYEISSKERYDAINSIQQRHKGLILAGNIRDGIGMSDRIAQARKVATEIIEGLQNG